MRACLVHSHRLTREVLARVLSKKLNVEVVEFSSIEELLDSSMDYDAFVVYSLFGRSKMDGWQGVKWIKYRKPGAVVVYMVQKRFFERHGLPPGADAPSFFASDNIDGLVKHILTRWKEKSTTGAADDAKQL